MKVYCINLKSVAKRREHMVKELSRLPCPHEFIEAIDGRQLPDVEIRRVYDKWRTRFRVGKDLSRGEIGCALSHLEFCRKVIASESGIGFVFEDDVTIGPETESALQKVEAFLSIETKPVLVQLPGLDRDIVVDNSNKELIPVVSVTGTYAYGINRVAAELLLRAFTPICMPIDHYAYLAKYVGLKLYAFHRQVIEVDNDGPSTIGSDRFLTISNPLMKLIWKVWRCFGTTLDMILR